jgi:peptidyl-prolyl cis-trans isomerase C
MQSYFPSARRRPRAVLQRFPQIALLAGVALVHGTYAFAANSVLPGDDQVVASRGGVDVTFAEIDARVMELPREVRGNYMTAPTRLEELVSALLLEKQLAAKAREFGIENDPYLAIQLEQAQTRFLAARAQSLAEERLDVPDFEALAEEKYLVNPDKYSGMTTLELRHVLVTDRGRSESEARARAEEVRRLALEGKRDFDELIAEYTEEKQKGVTSSGKLSKVVRGVMVPEFDAAAFALKEPGQISDVVKTVYGFHVIRLDQRVDPAPISFEQIKPKIVEELRGEYISRHKSALVDELRSKKIEATPERVAALRDRYTADGPRLDAKTAAAPAQ